MSRAILLIPSTCLHAGTGTTLPYFYTAENVSERHVYVCIALHSTQCAKLLPQVDLSVIISAPD
jgi:hypothetical protein